MPAQRHDALATLQRAIHKHLSPLTLSHLLVCVALITVVAGQSAQPVALAQSTEPVATTEAIEPVAVENPAALGRHVRYLPTLYRAGASAPTVSIAGVSDRQTVSGSITLQALVTASTSVREVSFYVNGQKVWTEGSTPYYLGGRANGYNTTQLANGAHVFKTVAATGSGQTATAQITLTVQNSTSAPAPSPSPTTAPTAAPAPSPSPTTAPTSAPAPNPSPASGSRSVKLGFYYNSPTDGTSAATVASKSDFVISSNTRWRDDLRNAGFQGTVLRYFAANEIEGPGPYKNKYASCDSSYDPLDNQAAYNQGDFCKYVHPNEDWFLHNGRGERLVNEWFDGRVLYHMNHGHPGWRAFARARFGADVGGFTGLYLDNVELNLYKAQRQIVNSDGVVKEYSTDDAFRSAMLNYLRDMNSLPGTLWANLVNDDRMGSHWDLYMPHLDGALQEAWGIGYQPLTPEKWEANLRQTEKVLAQGKGVMMGGFGDRGETTKQQFLTASYLLVTNGKQAYFRYSKSSAYRVWWHYNNYDVKLGAPKGPRYQTGQQWRRDFACGYVIADPVAKTGKIVQTCN